MWNRKAKRIAELEAELRHTRDNLGVARVLAGHPGLMQDIVVETGAWYSVSYKFQHTGGPTLSVADLIVEKSFERLYFDGGTSHDR